MKTILCRTLPIRSSTVTVTNLHTPLEQHSWHLYICPNENVIQISPQNSIFKVNYMFNKIPCKKERYYLKMEKYKTNSRPAPKICHQDFRYGILLSYSHTNVPLAQHICYSWDTKMSQILHFPKACQTKTLSQAYESSERNWVSSFEETRIEAQCSDTHCPLRTLISIPRYELHARLIFQFVVRVLSWY